MTEELRQSYKNVQLVARLRARNFYYSFVLLPREKRRALCAVYAFMRHCDDIADGAHSEDRKRELLRRWREQLDGALTGDCDGDPILPAFRDAVCRFSIPGQYFHWILDGVVMDLAVRRYESFADLYRYCFNVAGAVGLTCLQIFGFRDDKAKDYAEQCGIAFQLTNILRDVSEDARMERIYLPIEELRRFGYSPDELMKGVSDNRYFQLMTYQASRARGYYDSARNLLPLVDQVSRPALWAMMEIYRRLLDKIVQARYAVFGRTKALLAKAGYADGKGLPVFQAWSNPKSDTIEQEHEAIRKYLAQVGIRIEFQYNTNWPTFKAQVQEGKLLIFRYGWVADVPEPENFLYYLFHSQSPNNLTRYRNPEVDQLLDRARAEQSYLKRVELYRKIEQLIMEDSPVIALNYYSYERLFQKYVQSVEVSALGDPYIPMRKVWLAK